MIPGFSLSQRKANLLIVVIPALGYFVDIYDMLVFGIVRISSLRDLGITEHELLRMGVRLLNMQLVGMLIGGVLWGILGDRRGRKSVLFGSIFLYSICNILNAFITDVETYAWLRLLTGIGLAGELGAAITLIAESVPISWRGYSTSIMAGIGVSGAVLAAIIGQNYHWRTCYLIGGVMGLGLLILRARLSESNLFADMRSRNEVGRGKFLSLFLKPRLLRKFASCIAVGAPVWFVVGILVTFAPEVAKALKISEVVTAGDAIFWAYAGAALGDMSTGIIAQYLRSRNKAMALYLAATAILVISLFFWPSLTIRGFYSICFLSGLTTGYWATLMVVSAEQFGTNLRATVASTVPTFIRATGVLMTMSLTALRGHFDLIQSLEIIGLVAFALATFALSHLSETFDRQLDFIEEI